MKRLLIKAVILLLPFLVILTVFFIVDPMRIIYTYSSPTLPGVLINDRVFQARYLAKNMGNYNSFILGSSRSKAFKTFNWKKYSNADSCFHLGVNDETLFGLCKKIEYLNREQVTIKNVLLILDHRLLSMDKNHEAHIFREHPDVSGESAIQFYKIFFTAFLNPDFFKAYLDWTSTGVYKPSMKNYIFKETFEYVNYSGDINYVGYEKEIIRDSLSYYTRNREIFYDRKKETQRSVISSKGKLMLEIIQEVFKKQNTNYKVILSPNYDQKKINEQDLDYLKQVFGETKVFDYSGLNEITANIGNYYEEKHFKPSIANKLMQEVYGARIKNKGK